MEYNYVTNIGTCVKLIKDTVPVSFIYYSHVPTAIVALFLGLFIYFNNRRLLLGKLLLGLTTSFSCWVAIDLVAWVMNYNSPLTMFSWALYIIFDILIFIFSISLAYVFVYRKGIPNLGKIVLSLFFTSVILIVPTNFNLVAFDASNCNAIENSNLNYLIMTEQVAILFWIVVIIFIGYKKEADNEFKKQIFIFGSGIISFLMLFIGSGYVADYLVSSGMVNNYTLEPYGLFGMTIFLGIVTYLIVKYQAFNIKLIGAQALVYALVIIIGSQFFFIQNNTNRILTAITLIIASGFGYLLIKTIKSDLQRKDELQYMADALAVSNDRLKKADNAKTEFISIASHQLRTPLTVIKGYVSLLTEGTFGDVSEDVKRVIKNIKISNDRLIELVEDLLNISRMESGRMEFKFAPTDVPELCTELFNSFGARDKENHNIEFKLDLPKDGIRDISTDRGKLREVISNLIDNAVKYTPSGWVKIKAFQKDSQIVRIEVSDSGIGIPETEMPYLFAKFSRGKDTGRLTAPGTGLGLHVSRSMIEALHGKVWAESEGDKKGSTFIIELPVGSEESSGDSGKVRTEAPRMEIFETPAPAAKAPKTETPVPTPTEPIANDPAPQPEAPQKENPSPMKTEPNAPKTAMPASQAEPEGRIIFNEPKKRNRIV